MKKNETVFVADENGEFAEVERSNFIKFLIEKHDVQDLDLEGAVHSKEEVAKGILGLVEEGAELMDSLSDLQHVYDDVVEILTASKEYVDSQKDAAKEEKEAKKKEKEEERAKAEEEKKNLEKRQTSLMNFLKKGTDKASAVFKKDLEALKKGLPEGIEIASSEHGFGLNISKDITDAQLGAATGFFLQREVDSRFMQNTAGFFVGQLCNHFVKIGVYPSRMQAAKAICTKAEEQGKKIHPRGIESYARMDERIPLEFRNSEVVDKAYLELANAKKVKKADGEEKVTFKAREEAYENERLKIAKKLADGEITEVKDVKELISDMQIKHGLKEAPDPSKKSVGDYLRTYFLGRECVEQLAGVHEADSVVFQEKGGADELTYSTSDLDEMVEEARLNLVNVLFEYKHTTGETVTLADLIEGKKEMDVPVVDLKGKDTGEKKKSSVSVFPRPFFYVPKTEKKEEAKEEEEEAAEA
jgi:hypothetical protein